MKKTVIGIIIAILVIALGVGAYFMLNSDKEENTNNTNQDLLSSNNEEVNQGTDVNIPDNSGEIVGTEADNTDNTEADNTTSNTKKTLVVYYSAQNHTEAVSEKLAEQLDADLFEIIPEEVYSDADLNWTNKDSRVSREYADESLRDVKLEKDTVDNWNDYDTVLIGYPIWWGIAAWPVDTFVKANDFSGKTVIPFCTSASSGLGQSGKLLEEEANGGDWQEGHRFNERPSDSDIEKWVDTIR